MFCNGKLTIFVEQVGAKSSKKCQSSVLVRISPGQVSSSQATPYETDLFAGKLLLIHKPTWIQDESSACANGAALRVGQGQCGRVEETVSHCGQKTDTLLIRAC